MDKDGTFSLSSRISLSRFHLLHVNIFPNPIRRKCTVSWSGEGGRNGAIKMTLTNNAGQVVFARTLILESEVERTEEITLDVESGLYVCSFLYRGFTKQVKLVIE